MNPDVRKGDHLYFQHKSGPCAGRVLCHGRHGATIETDDGERHQVRWERVLGHKKRMTPAYRIVDQGDDGAIVEEPDGKRAFVQGLQRAEEDEVKSGDPESVWERLGKAGGETSVRVLFMKGAISNRPGLHLEDVTDKAGRHTKRWKKTGQEPAKERKRKEDPEDVRGAQHGYGTGNIQSGDSVEFQTPDHSGAGRIVAMGKDGATVKDDQGREHKVLWNEIRNRKAGGDDAGAKKARILSSHPQAILGKQDPIPADKFSAAEYAKSHDKTDVTTEHILSGFPPEVKQEMEAAVERLRSIEQTIDSHKKNGGYSPERQALHDKIIEELLSPEKIAAASPPPGESPTVLLFGGRGGSGKSAFTRSKDKGGLGLFDVNKFIVIDADEVKKALPEYEGWNAHQVHEESGEILDEIQRRAMAMQLNLIVDETMKTKEKAIKRVESFKEAGYRIEGHYMHLPRQEAAKRGVERYLNGEGKEKRLVPVHVILGNTGNEESFDAIKLLVDRWSFHDNNVPHGQAPILISSSEPLHKAMPTRAILLLRRASR